MVCTWISGHKVKYKFPKCKQTYNTRLICFWRIWSWIYTLALKICIINNRFSIIILKLIRELNKCSPINKKSATDLNDLFMMKYKTLPLLAIWYKQLHIWFIEYISIPSFLKFLLLLRYTSHKDKSCVAIMQPWCY